MYLRVLMLLSFVVAAGVTQAEKPDGPPTDSLVALRTIKTRTAGLSDQTALAEAWRNIAQLPADELPAVLQSMKDVGPIAENWFRAAIDAIAERQLAQGGELPQRELEQFLSDRSQSPRARRVAFELVTRVDDKARDRLLAGMLDDPSLELRRDAVAAVIDQAKQLAGEASISAYQKALASARDLEQIKDCIAALEKQEIEIDLARHLGFVANWHLIGPFDNKDRVGYGTAYPPETELNFEAKYEDDGKPLAWTKHRTDHKEGEVDLNKVYGEIKEVVAYAAGEFSVDKPTEAQLRVGCITACKVWLNGELVMDHEVYHAGYRFDQYISDVQLKAGRNVVLVKLCQNEQTQSWANVWKFSLRVTDKLGGGIIADND